MLRKIKTYALTLASMALMFVPTIGIPAVAGAAAAGCVGINQPLAEGANVAITNNGTAGGAADCQSSNANTDSLKKLAAKITNVFSIIVGAASVIMIIYGGFRYVTSGGESGRVGAAKNALLYAIVGLVIVAIAQLIVHFVLSQATSVNAGVS
jgi:hypothetical protein